MAAWYVSLFLVTRNMRPTLMIRNMRSTKIINFYCGSTEPVPLPSLKGVFDKTKTAIKVDEPVAEDRLNELKNNILTFLGKEAIPDTDASWIRHRDNFLRSANK